MNPVFKGKSVFALLVIWGIALNAISCAFLTGTAEKRAPTGIDSTIAATQFPVQPASPVAVESTKTMAGDQPAPAGQITAAALPSPGALATLPAPTLPADPTGTMFSPEDPTAIAKNKPLPRGLVLSQRFTETDLYRVNYPKAWLLSKNGEWQDICMDQAQTACFHVHVQNSREDTLATFMVDVYDAFKGSVSSYQLINRSEETLNGTPAVVIEQSYIYRGAKWQGFAAYLVYNGVGYQIQSEIIGQMTTEKYNLVYPTLRNMVESFQTLTVDNARAS